MSTVKGLRLINQGQIAGVQTKKITMANIADIDVLQISDNLKTKYRDTVRQGNTLYTPTKQYTYQNWTGLVYISINPNTGFGSYTIGEGLNGGHTVEEWPDGWSHFWRQYLVTDLAVIVIQPVNGQTFVQGEIIKWQAHYDGKVLDIYPMFWDDNVDLNTISWAIGTHILKSGYGTSKSVEVGIKGPEIPAELICFSKLEDRELPAYSGEISEEMHLPLWLDKSSGVFQERLNSQVQYNKQDDIYTHPTSFPDFFKNLTTPEETIYNINNPWIDPKTGKYWTMSITFGAFNKPAKEKNHEKYYMNMRWDYDQFPDLNIYEEQRWFFGKKVWIKNPVTKKAIVAGILDWGPSPDEGAAGASLETLKAIGARHDDVVEFCWADQNSAYGSVVDY